MDTQIHQNIQEGIMKFDNVSKGFKCLICDVPLTGEPSALDHLKSKQHRDTGGRMVIRNLGMASQSLVALLPDLVLTAARAGDLEIMVSNEILCRTCNSPNQGMIALNNHLQCKSHLKKLEERQKGFQETSNSPLSHLLTFSNPDVQQAVSENIVECLPNNVFQCQVCNFLPVTGEIPLKQHLDSKKHREAGAKYAIANYKTAPKSLLDKLPKSIQDVVASGTVTIIGTGDLQCVTCSVTFNGVISMEQHLIGEDHKNKVVHLLYSSINQPTANPLPSIPPAEHQAQNLEPLMCSLSLEEDPEITKARRARIIIETDNKLEPFQCKACDRKFNNSGPLLDHLRSKKHKTKEKMILDARAASQPTPDITSNEPLTKEDTGARKRQYSVISDIRGHVYVFNNTFKKTPEARRGAEHDSQNLEETFTRMGYRVFLHEDLTYVQTNQALKEIQRSPELNEIDSFIVFFLSHGVNEYVFYANDMEEMNLQSIRRMFTDRKCPYLRGKPKIFLANYCRGDQMEKRRLEADDTEVPRDMVTIHAATEGIKALREPSIGTIFVASLCEVLKTHAKESDLREIYIELQAKMEKMRGTVPMWEDYVFKSFHFNPRY